MKASKAATRRPPAPRVKPVILEQRQSQSWLPYGLGMLGALIAVFTVYGPALSGPFFLDDTYLPYGLPTYFSAPLSAWIRGTRPILMLSFWMNFQLSQTATGSYHLVNVLLHLLDAALTYLVVKRILEWAHVNEWQLEVLSVFGAGLFLLHPLQTESVSYVASRSETLSVLFFLGAFAVFLYRKSVSASWLTSLLVLLLFGAACLTKEHAAVLPAVLLLTDYYWNPGFSFSGIRRNWKVYLPIVVGAIGALVFITRVLATANSAGFGIKDFTWYQYFFTQCRAIWRYFLFFIFPVGQNIDHEFPPSMTVLDQGAIIGLIGLIALVAAAWIYRRRFPVASYGVLLTLILFSPTSSVVPIRDTLVEHRMYLPFIGFVLTTVGLLRWWKTSRTTLVVTLGAVLLVAAGLTYSRNQLWGDLIAMWSDSAAKSPHKVRPEFQLAYAKYNAGQCAEAAQEFEKTAKLEKPDASLLVDWGLAEDCAGNEPAAMEKLQQAARLERSAHIYSQIGMVYAKQKQYPQALDALDVAAALDPEFAMTFVYRGNIYTMLGSKQSAIADFKKALALDPENSAARTGLAVASR